MTIKGQITAELPEVSGVSKSGKAWRKKTYVLTYDTFKPEYPKAVVFDVMGDKIDELRLLQGRWYEVSLDFSAREFGDRWYMSATAWKVTELQSTAPHPEPISASMGMPPLSPPTATDEGLPF